MTDSSCDSDTEAVPSSETTTAVLNSVSVDSKFKYLDSIFMELTDVKNRRLLSMFLDKEQAANNKLRQKQEIQKYKMPLTAMN